MNLQCILPNLQQIEATINSVSANDDSYREEIS